MRVVVASENPVKMNATKAAFERVFPDQGIEVSGISVESGVSDQPMSDQETRTGAENRATAAKQTHPEADFWVGIEGGIQEDEHGLAVIGWIVTLSEEKKGMGKCHTFYLPDAITKLVHEGKELSDADDEVFGRENSGMQNGTVGFLTRDLITRSDNYIDATILSLIPFIHQDLY